MGHRCGASLVRLCVLGGLALGGAVMVSQDARAQASATDQVLARSLFEQGRELMSGGKIAEACAKFAESHRLDPAPGTYLNLAACHEKEGRTATAWAEFNTALSQARREGRADREKFAQERIASISAKLSRLTVRVSAEARVNGLEVKLDGVLIGQAAWGAPVPADPGVHQVEVTATGKKKWTGTVEVSGQGGSASIEVPALEDAPKEVVPAASAGAPPKGAAPISSAQQAPPSADQGTEQGSSGKRMTGYVVGAAGLVALGVGGYFGLRSFSKWDESKSHCPGGACDADGVSLHDQASMAAYVADVGMGLGLVGIGVGTYLLLTSGPARAKTSQTAGTLRVAPAVGATGASVMVGGAW